MIAGANVTLTNEGTDISSKGTSSPQGFYTFPILDPGQYTVTVDARGFKNTHFETQRGSGRTIYSRRFYTFPWAVNQQVTVTGSTPLVESTSSDLGRRSTRPNQQPARQRQTPSAGDAARSRYHSCGMGAGNPEDSSRASSTAPGGGGGGDYTSTNGFPFEGNLYLVDGVTDVELKNAYMGLQIPFDFVGEMKLETSDPSAEYGTFGGMVSNITTKTGTNRFHGQVFEYNRNNDFNEPDYFSKINPPFHSNQFGGEVDGPILKDKLFFSADLQWLKIAEGSSGITSVPTAAARSGNLSGFDTQRRRPDYECHGL